MGTESKDNLFRWRPLSPMEVWVLLNDLSIPWWIAGGWAIDLHVGTPSRRHLDTDVLILRKDQLTVQEHLSEWDLFKAAQPGLLRPWPPGEFLRPGVNDVWCRRTSEDPWSLQLMFMEVKRNCWVFRRDGRISGPLENLGKRTPSGIPYVNPEIQLLFKSNNPGLDRNNLDFQTILPVLEVTERDWLLDQFELLYPEGHPWSQPLANSQTK